MEASGAIVVISRGDIIVFWGRILEGVGGERDRSRRCSDDADGSRFNR